MLFNSIAFALFFAVVFSLYLILDHKGQNKMLLMASYVFYGAWDYRFLALLGLSTCLDYVLALKISETENPIRRKAYLILSLTLSLTFLGFFKYFNFFIENLTWFLGQFGIHATVPMLHIILPVGISFYTFQTISYVVDVYRKELPAEKNFIHFALFVSFFPQLVAGPIERATNLLPQIVLPRQIRLTKICEGSGLIFWGLFKKVVIADHAAAIVNSVYGSGQGLPGFAILMATYAFAAQIYCDFSGYTDIARGIAKWMGFELMLNFNKPYLATNPVDFWRRWHISLSTILRDYLYVPLGGNRGGIRKTCVNLMLTMLLGGLWHGAAWTFVAWGIYHGLLLVGHRLLRASFDSRFNHLPAGIKALCFFQIVCLGWIFFRAESLPQAFYFIHQILFDFRFSEMLALIFYSPATSFIFLVLVILAALYFINYKNSEPRWPWARMPWGIRWGIYTALFQIYLLTAVTHANQFIYFQF